MRDPNYGVRLANAAWIAPLLAIAANVLAIVLRVDGPLGTVAGCCGPILVSFGLCSAILALDAIRDLGYRGILLPAIIGLILNGALIGYVLMGLLELMNLFGR